MFRIVNVINNNVALAKNENHEEVMITGNGIAFQKKKGDIIVQSKIEKVFRLNTEESKNNFLTLLQDVPLDFITVTYDVINSLISKYHYPFQEYLYVTLTDHIYSAYQAIHKGIYEDGKLPDISVDYPLEFEMAEYALDMFKKKLLDSFPDNETERIALHFINAKGGDNQGINLQIDQSKQIIEHIKRELANHNIVRRKENAPLFDRFMIHLNYFLEYLDRSRSDNPSLLDMEDHIKQSYPKAFEIGSKIYDVITQHTGLDLYKSERVYLVLHIQRLLS
ncbi:transcription antiterminator LacT [Streptococcus pneumoniae]|nr:transcription antiterminator LacT [Streptococcus pneumoniae]